MRKNQSIKNNIAEATNGLAKTAVNGLLWWLYLVGASIGKSRTSRGVYEMFREADEALRDCNYEHFQQLLHQLQKQHLIAKRRKRTEVELSITKLGRERLSEFLPTYKKTRPWDGYVYIISYDIPESSKTVRDQFRQYLVKIGCAKLQASVWMTPHAPQDLVNDFATKHHVEGAILVSKLDKYGMIGDETLSEVMVRIYCLDDINKQYEDFLLIGKQKSISVFQSVVLYESILRDDPQLPFELLPSWWMGEDAHHIYQFFLVK
ncbi:CRISPR-associated endonuclease Cas2 [Patescibacteria group bacterium]|nr:CRISPR-associated endonuclease Cas2 [Patescibacteria group bacterium]MBU1472583.1 CRISPR-associated endonuclease Cas2 [Patescibacteria group bacterium]MBU2459834.1 CRISPR-associated endonuclease Cas2 [Patescibacteria group bacterium]MBU2544105.1 CRISPR-associated endonuclease Cas2 [Patescibacteria group bacterium]